MGTGEIGKRLEVIRKNNKMQKREFAYSIGIHPNSYTNYISGERELPTKLIKKICSFYKISFAWLMLGAGQMKDSTESPTVLSQSDMIFLSELFNIEEVRIITYKFLSHEVGESDLAQKIDTYLKMKMNS